jgi:hypothetical protein
MKQIPESGMETSYTACQQEVQNSTTGGKIEADIFLFVTLMDQCCNTTKKGAQEQAASITV